MNTWWTRLYDTEQGDGGRGCLKSERMSASLGRIFQDSIQHTLHLACNPYTPATNVYIHVVHTHTVTHEHTHTHMHSHTKMCTHAYIQWQMHVHEHTRTRIHTHLHTLTHAQDNKYTQHVVYCEAKAKICSFSMVMYWSELMTSWWIYQQMHLTLHICSKCHQVQITVISYQSSSCLFAWNRTQVC